MIGTRACLFPKPMHIVHPQASLFQTARHKPTVGQQISSAGSQMALKTKIKYQSAS